MRLDLGAMGHPGDLLDDLRRLARAHRMAAFGIADTEPLLRREPALFDRLPCALPRAVVMGIRLQDAVIDGIDDRPTPLYFHVYRQANHALDRAAFQAAAVIQDRGSRAIAVAASQTISRQPMTGHISHKLMGWAAGIGWLGRSTLLVHPQFGARVRYVTVLTDAPLPAARPLQHDCGSCRMCVTACPVNAIHERREQFDLDACYAKLTQFSKLQGIGQHICGICVKACGGAEWRQQFRSVSGDEANS